MAITARTRLVGVMGWPVGHSRSPQMQNAALLAAGIDAVYTAMPVAPDRVGEAVRGLRALGFVGANVTIPHKEAVVPHLDRLTPEAAAIGAVNTIRVEHDGTLTGHNTDCLGAVAAVEHAGARLAGATVAIIGAGGAGRGCAAGCALAGARRILVLNRTADRARELVDDLSRRLPGAASVEWQALPLDGTPEWNSIDIVFQMTSMGMKDNRGLPIKVETLRPGCHILEAVYVPLETPLLAAARARGLPTVDGLAMLLEQGAAAFQFWFGVQPDRHVMRTALEASNA